MIFLIIVLILLNIMLIFLIFKEVLRNKNRGEILMKLKFDFQRYLVLITWITIGFLYIYLISKDIEVWSGNNEVDMKFFILHLLNSICYVLLSVLIIIRVIIAGEIREKGISILGGFVDIYDIRGVTWISENKFEIKFIGHIIHRIFKVKWKAKTNQIAEINRIFGEVYQIPCHSANLENIPNEGASR